MNSFEAEGFWWDPREPATRWPGTLTFDPVRGATLRRTMPFHPEQIFGEVEAFPMLYGEGIGGKPYTLLRAFETSGSEIFANAVIGGFHAESPDPLVARAAALVENLPEWWGLDAVAHDPSVMYPQVAVSYTPPPDVEVFADEEMRIAVRSAGLPSYEAHSFSLKEEIRFELAAVTPKPLSVFRRRVHACQDLLSVATLSLCNVEEMRIVPARLEGRPGVVGVLHAVPVFRPKERAHHDFLFQYRDVKDRVREVFSSWLSKADSLSAARALYTSGTYGDAFLEIRLLSYTQAVEAYHRREYEGRNVYMDPGAYEREVLPGLQAAIPGGLQPSHRDALRNRLRFGNEYSFRKRLGMMFDEHRAALTTVVPCADDWIDRIKDYRNGFTHHPVVDELHDMDTDEVLRCNEVLRLVLELSFLKAMELSGDTIRDLAQGCHRYRAVRRRFFEAKP